MAEEGFHDKLISNIAIIIAMQAEALPLVERFGLVQDDGSLFFHRKPEALAIFRTFSELEILRPAKTRFTYMIIAMKRLIKVQDSLRQTVLSDAWKAWPGSKEPDALKVQQNAFHPKMWNLSESLMKTLQPVYNVLRLADSEGCTLGLIYEFMDKVGESLRLNQNSSSGIRPERFPEGVPWTRYFGMHDGVNINVIITGKCSTFGVDNVGTVPAALVTYAAIQALNPDLIINAGTSGGFKAKGASIGDVFVVTDVAYHDRRIPIPVFDKYGIGSMSAHPSLNLVETLGLKVGKLSTGNSLDMMTVDEELIKANDASVKDMEGAAIVYVARLLSVPVILLKTVTDIVDGDRPTSEEFLENLSLAALSLLQTTSQVIEFIKGKRLCDL